MITINPDRQHCHRSRSTIVKSGVLFFSAFLFLSVGISQRAQESTLSVDVNVVSLLATVRNRHGQIVKDLNQNDFKLEEDGRPQAIRYFARETNLPLSVGLLIDTSLSQRRLLGEERNASYRFLDEMLRENKDRAFIMHFDREVELLEDLTSSRKRLESALSAIETPTPPQWTNGGNPRSGPGGPHRHGRMGGTLLYDAVFLASDEVIKRQAGRKAFIVLSDGVDTGSRVDLQRAIEAAQRADTPVYTILFADEQMYGHGGGFGGWPRGGGRMGRYPGGSPRMPQSSPPDGKKVLRRLAVETGASFFEVSGKQTISEIYAQIQEELRSQYSLGYTPDRKMNPGYHKIHLTTLQKDLTVQTRDGYYANW